MSRQWRRLFAVWAISFLCSASGLQAAPQVSWGEQVRLASLQDRPSPVSLNLIPIWEATRVGQVALGNQDYFDPEQVWSWPAERFNMLRDRESYFLKSGQRYVARVSLLSQAVGTDVNLSAVLPRLDAMHVSYRYDKGPWKTLSAGDTLAMDRWHVPERHPSFDLPQLSGQMDLVVQVAHRGNAFAPVVLQNDRAQMAALTSSTWSVGMMVGIHGVMLLISVLLAISFRNASFLSVSLMSLLIGAVIFFGSGVGGLYWATSSSVFNDAIKFFSTTLWCLALPWVTALVLGLHQRSRGWQYLTSSLFLLGVGMTWLWMDYAWRDSAAWGVPALLILTLMLTTVMVFWSGWRHIALQPAIVMGVVLYALSLLMPLTSFLGLITNSFAGLASAGLMLLSSFLLIHGLYVRHRMGRQVLARAKISPLRDVLTGLLNREGMQAHLYKKVRSRIQSEHTSAVFIYISVMDAEQAMQEHGEQGFEIGMVQIAASLSTSVAGVDGLARISRHAFGACVFMPPNSAQATRLAQKILSRLMALASHTAPLAGTARMAMAWLPLNGFRVDTLERLSLRTLEVLDPAKRIGWVGGAQSHADALQMHQDAGVEDGGVPDPSRDSGRLQNIEGQESVSSTLYERIHRIEREMLQGMDTGFLMAEADRMSQDLHEVDSKSTSEHTTQASIDDSEADPSPTELLSTQQPPHRA